MKDEIDIIELKGKLRDIIPLQSGGSFKLLWDMLYHIRLLKYVRRSQLKDINPSYSKICASKKMAKLVELGLIKNSEQDVFIPTEKSLDVLKHLGYNTKTLPKNIKGEGGINELHNTDVFIQALKLLDYFALLYPVFYERDFQKIYLKPDALLVRGTKNRYKLEFLEVEAGKSDWNNYLEKKRINYLKLAHDKNAYNEWKQKCILLEITPPDIKDFKFSVSIIGKIKKDFGIGFNFMEKL